MRKIKRFKVPVYYKDLLRRLSRAPLNRESAGLADDAAAKEYISCLAGKMDSGVVFDTFEDNFPEAALAALRSGKVFSVCFVTLGKAISDSIASIANPDEKHAASMIACGFFDNAASFVLELIQEEAARDTFELADMEVIASPLLEDNSPITPLLPRFLRDGARLSRENALALLPLAFEKLNAAKIGVELLPDSALYPPLSAAFLVPWIAKKRQKK